MKVLLKHIGPINFNSLRDFILDFEATDNYVIVVNRKNFDDLVLEHRTLFGRGVAMPLQYLGIIIQEDNDAKVPVNRIGVRAKVVVILWLSRCDTC